VIPTIITILIALTIVGVHFKAYRSADRVFTATESLILAGLYLAAIAAILATWLIWSLFFK